MVLISASAAPMLMPISFNGIEINQMMGQIISASRASGQHSANRMNQTTTKSRAFTGL